MPSPIPPPAVSVSPSPCVRIVKQLYYDQQPDPHQPNQKLSFQQPTVVALAQAPFHVERAVDTSYLICAEEFFEDNPLIAATLQLRTQQKYAVALENFRSSPFAKFPQAIPLDHRVCRYIQDAFTKNPKPGNRQEMTNLLCILLIMYPSLRGSNLGLSKRCIAGWRTLCPARSSAPFTKELVLALAWRLVNQSKTPSAVTLLTTFCGCLRVSEALSLQIEDIAFPGDTRIAAYGPGVAGVNIRDVKTARYTGKLQFVKIEDSDAIRLIHAWKSFMNTNSGPLLQLTYQAYSADLKAALAFFGIHKAPFTSHSARIGKATQDYITGVPVEQIAINGRWKSINSLRYYVTNGRAWLLDTNIPSSAQYRINAASRSMHDIIHSASGNRRTCHLMV